MKIVLAQFFTDNLSYGKYSKEINELYCAEKGYIYHLESNSEKIRDGLEGRSPTWYKPKLLSEILEKYNPDYVLFLDADAVVMNNHHRIESFIQDSADVVVTEDYGPSKLNAGVLLFKNTQWSKKFIQDWWNICEEYPQYKTGLWHDQTCFGLLMDRTENLQHHIRVIDNRILNSRYANGECFVFHAFSYGMHQNRTLDHVHMRKFDTAPRPAPEIPKDKDAIAIVYHVYCVNDWKSVVDRQLCRLQSSGLYDSAEILWVTAHGSSDKRLELDEIFKKYPKFKIEWHKNNVYEYPGIKKVYDLGRAHSNLKILYLHAKGVSNKYKKVDNPNVISEQKVKSISQWVECLEYFLIDNWRECLVKLGQYDNVGVTCNNGWYWGNFWWTQSKHIERKLPPIHSGRWYYEAWLNEGVDSSNYQFYHFEFNAYLSDIPRFLYDGSTDLKNQNIEIIDAKYGTLDLQIDEGWRADVEEKLADVTHILKKNLEDRGYKGFDIFVDNNSMGGDPNYGFKKFLIIRCKLNDAVIQFGVSESQHFRFSI